MKRIFILPTLLLLLAVAAVEEATAQQDCPRIGPWRLQCPQYCCVKDFDEPLEGQYCCSSCRYSYDSAVRNSYKCTSSHYLHQTWAAILIAFGIAFILLVCCTCCCCCCCAPCRNRSRQRRPYVCCESGKLHQQNQYQPQYQYQHRYYGSVAGPSSMEASQRHPLPTAPPASVIAASSGRQAISKGGEAAAAAAIPQPPPYQAAGGSGSEQQQQQLPPPPTYAP